MDIELQNYSQFEYKFQDWSWNLINICSFQRIVLQVWKWNSARQFPLHNIAVKSSWVITGYRYSFKCCQFAYYTYFFDGSVLSYTLRGLRYAENNLCIKPPGKSTCWILLVLPVFLHELNFAYLKFDMTWQVSSGKISFEKHLYDAFKLKDMCFGGHFDQVSRSRSHGAWALTSYHMQV